jgi:hypothetical protein
VVWQGSAGDCRPYADLARHPVLSPAFYCLTPSRSYTAINVPVMVATSRSMRLRSSEGAGITDGQCSSWLQDVRSEGKLLTFGRRNQICLEFYGEHSGFRGHERKSGIPTGTIKYRGDNSSMYETVLLSKFWREGHHQLDLSGV